MHRVVVNALHGLPAQVNALVGLSAQAQVNALTAQVNAPRLESSVHETSQMPPDALILFAYATIFYSAFIRPPSAFTLAVNTFTWAWAGSP